MVFFLIRPSGIDLEPAILRIPVFASDFTMYEFNLAGEWKLVFPYEVDNDSYRILTLRELQTRFPRTMKYLSSNRGRLEARKQYKEWYGSSAPRNLSLNDRTQKYVPLLANAGIFPLVPEDRLGTLALMASGGFGITLKPSAEIGPKYLPGLINSKLLFWNLQQLSNIFRGGWITSTKQYFGELPIRKIDFNIASQKLLHDKVVNLVLHIIETRKLLKTAKSDRNQTFYKNKSKALDDEINMVVNELYELTPEEIAITEGR